MALDAKQGTQAWATTATVGTQFAQACGFDPKIVFFKIARNPGTDGRTDQHARYAFGAATGIAARVCVSTNSRDGRTTGSTGCGVFNDAVAVTYSASGLDGKMDIDQFGGGTNGFRLIVDDAEAAFANRVSWLALGGTDIGNVKVGTFEEPAATGTQDITGLGFNPADGDLLMIAGCNATQLNHGATAADCKWTIGACTSASDEHVVSGGSEEVAVDSDTYHLGKSGSLIVILDNTGAIVAEARFDSWITDGFRIEWLSRAVTGREFIFAVVTRAGDAKFTVGESNVRATAGTHDVTGMGHAPEAVMVFSVGDTENTTAAAHNRLSMGFSEVATPSQFASGAFDEDALANTETEMGSQFDAVLHTFSNSADIDIMAVDSYLSDGLRFSTATAGGGAPWFFYVAFGLEDAGGGDQAAEPTAAQTRWDFGAPVIVPGATTIVATAAQTRWNFGAPTIVPGAVNVAATAAQARWNPVTPAISAVVTIIATAAQARWAPTTPTVVPGATNVAATAAKARWSPTTPIVVPGTVQVAATAATARWSPTTPTIVPGATVVAATSARGRWSPVTPSVPGGASIVTPTAAQARWAPVSATIVPGGTVRTATAAQARWAPAQPVVIPGTVFVGSTGAQARWVPALPDVLTGPVALLALAAQARWSLMTWSADRDTAVIDLLASYAPILELSGSFAPIIDLTASLGNDED